MTFPFENDNEAIVKKLARRSFKVNLLRNIVAAAAIILTAILFTSVTTIGIGTAESLQLNMQWQKMSRSDAEIRLMTAEQFGVLQNSEMVKSAGVRCPVGFLTNSARHNIELDVMDDTQMGMVFTTPTHGKTPKSADEIVASDRALRDLGVEPEVGAEVTIEFTAHGKEYVLPMTVSGWYDSIHEQLSMMVLAPSFMEAYPDIFAYTYPEDLEMAGTYYSDILLKSRTGIAQQLDDFVRSVGGDLDNQEAANFLHATVNQVTNPTPDISITAMLILFVILFMVCGYLLIYNVFDISVMQSIRQYGLYRTVGMSKRQVRQLINKQALWLSCIGVPLGLLAGYFIRKISLPIIMNIFSTEYSNLDTSVSPKPVIFIGSAILTVLTVWISTRKSVRTAANIPPIEAFRYVEKVSGKKSEKRGFSGTRVSHMAWSNLSRNRRRTGFIVVSLILCVVLLNSVGIIAESVDVEKQVQENIRTDFCVVNTRAMSNFAGFLHRSDALNDEAVKAINEQPGVETGSLIHKNTLDDLNVTFDIGREIEKTLIDSGEEDHLNWLGWSLVLPLGTDGYPSCNVFGMDESALARLNIVEGETDFAKLYREITVGNGVIVGIEANMKTSLPWEYLDFIEIGDTISARVDGKEVKTYTVVAKAALNGDDMEVSNTCNGFNSVGGGAPALYLPLEEYRELYSQPTVMKYSFNVADDQKAAMSEFLKDYTEITDPSTAYFSAELARENAESMRKMISFVGGTIGIIFGMAGVLNHMTLFPALYVCLILLAAAVAVPVLAIRTFNKGEHYRTVKTC